MLLANYHTHTARCRHAWGEDKEYVENAIQEGMKVLGFSDHCPWIFPKDYVSHTRMEPQELDGYFYALEALRQEYARDITIYIGFESEYIPELMEEQNQLLDGYPVDYMILGEHFTASEVTGPYTGFPTESEQDLEKYVDLCIAGMETGKYVYVAHPDLIHYTGTALPVSQGQGYSCGDQSAGRGGKEALYLGALSENCTAHRELCHYWLRCAHAGSAVQSGIHSDLSGSGAAFWLAGG